MDAFLPDGGVVIYSLPPKVGDTLNAIVTGAAAAKYEWAVSLDGEEWSVIDSETDETFDVTADLVGMYVKVTVTAEDEETASDVTSSPVYDSLALLSADQTGKSVVTLTTNGPVTALDDIDVLKGSKEVEIDSIDYEDDGAVVTLKNAIVADAEYTVTLTPADEDDEATSATFTGEKAELERIEFLNNVLVMKDSSYSKGFAYVKGYDQFDDEVTLSGLTVTPGIGQFESYDITTGKITIGSGVAAGETSPFMTVKEVPVFVQYQAGTNIVSAQANLTVSTQAYLASLEFGEIDKDGTKRDDERLTITELSSKKYYVEILDPQDQYGNTLSADDLNAQKDGDNGNKTLFVIPDNKSGAFYKTGNFGTLNGKTILWLEDIGANTRPGTMALTITGAGGATFTTDVTIEDDPYIDTLNVTYPALYPNVDESDELEFSAVDQYGDPVDLFSFKPENTTNVKTLNFGDANHMANKNTSIQISGAASFNRVTYNSAEKNFKVTLSTWGAEKGNIISFVANTAGLKVTTASVTVGGTGTSAKIKSSGSSIQLVSLHDETYDFNNKIQFEDANGQVMKRTDTYYPRYADATALTLSSTKGADFKPYAFFWTLAENKLTAAGTPDQTWNSARDDDGNRISVNGKFNVWDMDGETQDVYVILWGEDNTEAVLLDQKPFHFTRTSGVEKSWTASCSDTLYVKDRDDYEDSVSVKVTAKTDKGETYEIKGGRITLGGIPFETSNNTVYGDYPLDEDGSKVATVYVDGDEKTSVTINYSNDDPVPAKASWKFKTTNNGSRKVSKFGTEVSGDAPSEFDTAYSGTSISIAKGVMTITNANYLGDTFTAKIADQYGNDWENTIFKANGVEITDGFEFKDGEKYVIEYSAEGVTGRFTMYAQDDITASVEQAKVAKSVKTDAQLAAALANPEIDEIYVDYLANLNGLTISKDVYYRGDGDDVVDAITMAAVTLNGGDLIFEAEDVTITTLTMTDGDVYVNEGAKLTLGGAVALGDNNIYVNGGILSTGTDITTATGKTGAVVLGADAELDATASINITNLTITEAATTSSPAIVDATGQTITVTKATIAGHGVLADGTIKAAATGAEINITGTSLALAKTTAVLDLTGLAAANIKSINLGTNDGEVIVTTNDALVSLLGNAATNGKISVDGAITLSANQQIKSTKAIEIADANKYLTGTILCNKNNKLTVSGDASNLVVANSGDLTVAAGATVKEVDNKSTGDLTVKGTGTVTTLRAEAGSETTVESTGTVTNLTGTTGGTLNAEAGATIAGQSVTAPGTVENITASTTGTDVNTEAAKEARTILDALSITNPTTLTTAEYKTANTDKTDTTEVKADLLTAVKALVVKALGTNYDSEKDKLEVTIAWTDGTVTNPIAATNTGKYKVTVELNGATKTDEKDTNFTFTNLPTGPKAAAAAKVTADGQTIKAATLSKAEVAQGVDADAVKTEIAKVINAVEGLNYKDYAVTEITPSVDTSAAGDKAVTVTLKSAEENATTITGVSVTVAVADT